jgi:hypothetical protein
MAVSRDVSNDSSPQKHCSAQDTTEELGTYTMETYENIERNRITCAARSTPIFEKDVKYMCSYLILAQCLGK